MNGLLYLALSILASMVVIILGSFCWNELFLTEILFVILCIYIGLLIFNYFYYIDF